MVPWNNIIRYYFSLILFFPRTLGMFKVAVVLGSIRPFFMLPFTHSLVDPRYPYLAGCFRTRLRLVPRF